MTALLACAAPAAAVTCMTGEYAKDKTATDSVLNALAADYCRILRTFPGVAVNGKSRIRRSTSRRNSADIRASDACIAELQKMLEAASAAGKAAEFKALTDSCTNR
jgi:hypothetical protein